MRRSASSRPALSTAVPLAAAVTLLVAAILTGCSTPDGLSPHPAVTAVSELLELRREDVRDPVAYEPYVADAALASALAGGSTEPTGTPRVPAYRPPYLSAESTSTAEVAVVWERDAAFAGWAQVTVFSAELDDARWVVTDAFETTVAPEPLLPEAD